MLDAQDVHTLKKPDPLETSRGQMSIPTVRRVEDTRLGESTR